MKIIFGFVLFFVILVSNQSEPAEKNSGITVNVNKSSGEYSIKPALMNWTFSGSIGHTLTKVKNFNGKDAIGKFNAIKFNWKSGTEYEGIIKWYEQKPVVIFSMVLPNGSSSTVEAFPSFTKFPEGMHTFSYFNDNFAPPQFKLNETSTPWLFFDNQKNSFIISPASDFIVSKMTGNGTELISSGLNSEIKNFPAKFTHSTILVFANGITNAWNIWGKSLRAIYKRKIPPNDADDILKYYGYWTDNGADYYYNYDTTLGYAQTLLTLRKRYEHEGIPLGYMQLDSWWYEKSIYDPEGKPDADHKNPNLPFGKWNRYGGLMSYTADPFLFPNGLTGFHNELKLPLVTHSRWIDPHSPYHDKYKISGFAAVDPKYWDHIINYIHNSDVVCYEQDWLNYIYNKSPEMASTLNIGNEFTDGMADACKKYGLSMQYCMAMPRFFLQGLKYNNLTTIRTSGDRFEPAKWKHFLYTSQLAYECGIYPWCDVFKSSETGNMILSVLSAGAVGTGDAIGKEDKANIMMACRTDGVLVKPDVPILPVDEDFINDATGKMLPTIAYAYTKHNKIITGYVFAFKNDASDSNEINFVPAKLGIKGAIVVFNPLNKNVKVVENGQAFLDHFSKNHFTYYVLAPLNSSGIAFFGDAGKIASTGKQRIAEIRNEKGKLKIKVLFANGESFVNLEGYSQSRVECNKGKASYNSKTHIFDINLPSDRMKEVDITITEVK